jgi:hypothetical protein
VVAVGSLTKVWVDFPEEFADMESLTGRFEQFFGRGWREVMLGGDRPFAYHRGWEAYFGVAGLAESDGPVLSGLLAGSGRQGIETYNIIIG